MPDFIDFAISRIASASLTVPRWRIVGRIVDSDTQQKTLADFTGASGIIFPTVLGNLTNAQQDKFVQEVITDLITKRFGL